VPRAEAKPGERPLPQEARQQSALRYVHTYGSITSGIYRKLTGVGENTATRDLEALVDKGALRAFGVKRGRYYML
jgi:predicted HTH transcriptional regulator